MKIQHWTAIPNFGDALNTWLFPKIFPGVFDENESELFIGIGSILAHPYPETAKKVVFGAAYVKEFGNCTPRAGDAEKWRIYFVRGKHTCASLGISDEYAIADSALLISEVELAETAGTRHKFGFMPHWRTHVAGIWPTLCANADILYINPMDSVELIISSLRSCDTVLTESLHGAIVADAFRIPWIALKPFNPIERSKWDEWFLSIELENNLKNIWPANMNNLRNALADNRKETKAVSGNLIEIIENRSSIMANNLRKVLSTTMVNPLLGRVAAVWLKNAVKSQPVLSADPTMRRIMGQMNDKRFQFLKDISEGKIWSSRYL